MFVINLNLAIVFGFVRCCYISALVLNCFRLKKGRATFFRPETIVASFLHSMVLLPKVIFNQSLQLSKFRLLQQVTSNQGERGFKPPWRIKIVMICLLINIRSGSLTIDNNPAPTQPKTHLINYLTRKRYELHR